MLNSVSLTRQSMLDELEQNFQYITWIGGRLPDYVMDSQRTLGAVSTISEIQQSGDYFVVRTILVQVYLPITQNKTGNISLDKIADPTEIENLATNIVNTLSAVEDQPQGSWFYRHLRTDYPNDPNGGQTRAAIQFAAYENSADTF